MRRSVITVLALTLLAVPAPAAGQEAIHGLVLDVGEADVAPGLADSLLALLESHDPARLEEIEARYVGRADPEKRLIERRFGLIEHRYRVDADPRGIYRRYRAEGLAGPDLERAMEEVVAGRYTGYYFFDGVIRPNPFAPDHALGRRESVLHEKVHLVQPGLYRALGLRCLWRSARDACVRSLEPVAVYLTEFASLKRDSPTRTDVQINRAIERWLTLESMRCGYGRPVPRCPHPDRIREYIVEPLEVARSVGRHGLEEGIRRYVEGLSVGEMAGLAPPAGGSR